ncbi:hypothetical protein [Mesoflavibacter profundi]|uniref:hypothetical protein n=1 Tax=Mesoflavibacter profundi TaxID=2708110 RepID=UPI00168B3BE5|nr:hypothetical protein [Mesoflavibacter profundi]
MNKLKLLLISILLISCNNSEKENQLAKENEILKQKLEQKEKTEIKMQNINDFIPSGFEIVESGNELNKIMSDLNKDGISDYVVLLASGKNNKDYSNSKNVRLAIFEGQNNGSYKLKSQSGNLTSSFLHKNPNKRIKVANKNVISLKHQSMRHDYELKFRYESKYKNYMLIGSEYNNYGNAMQDGAGNISSNFLAGKRISTIDGKKTTKVDKDLKPISAIDDYNIYELISE